MMNKAAWRPEIVKSQGRLDFLTNSSGTPAGVYPERGRRAGVAGSPKEIFLKLTALRIKVPNQEI